MIAILFPRFDHEAIEERYASWQSQMLLRREEGIEFTFYDAQEPASVAAGLVESDHPKRLAMRLRELLVRTPEVVAALPVSNEAGNPNQRRTPPAPYLTLRELAKVTSAMQSGSPSSERVTWDRSDPGAFLCRTAYLDGIDDPPFRAIEGREVVISHNDYAHRWIVMRAEMRNDLLPLIPTDAKSIIELGCGEGALGAAIKQRQKCRVVGVELDPRAAAIARKRIDAVYNGNVQHIVEILKEKFECIVGSERRRAAS
ncbi:MAG: hypothetical protein DMF59_17510 [Acidobacteria bacterium]|nr:MAG: hypothetical protein DMF59_17510 [Acidobacteriota bacterium]